MGIYQFIMILLQNIIYGSFYLQNLLAALKFI
jgi:hypothetical protein